MPDFLKAKRVLTKEHANLTLLIGNGINLAQGGGGGISWQELIQQLIKAAFQTKSKAYQRLTHLLPGVDGRKPASYPEIFDIIAAAMGNSATPGFNLQKHIAELLKNMKPGPPHQALMGWAQHNQVPVLTTNYDHCLQDALPQRSMKRRRFGRGNALSDYYPWDRYYAPAAIQDPLSDFALWHLHGDRDYWRSLRVGLDQYMGTVQRLRDMTQQIAKHIYNRAAHQPLSFEKARWLPAFMSRKLWIQGLGLGIDEVSIRWLLIQRYRFWRALHDKDENASGWYVHGPTEKIGNLDDQRRIFFENVGLQVLEISKAEEVYCGLFG